jgi:TPR repeat protein
MSEKAARQDEASQGNPVSDNDADSLFDLGMRYSAGRDVEQDLVTAHKWFNLAAMMGHEGALDARAGLAREMTAEVGCGAALHRPRQLRHRTTSPRCFRCARFMSAAAPKQCVAPRLSPVPSLHDSEGRGAAIGKRARVRSSPGQCETASVPRGAQQAFLGCSTNACSASLFSHRFSQRRKASLSTLLSCWRRGNADRCCCGAELPLRSRSAA